MGYLALPKAQDCHSGPAAVCGCCTHTAAEFPRPRALQNNVRAPQTQRYMPDVTHTCLQNQVQNTQVNGNHYYIFLSEEKLHLERLGWTWPWLRRCSLRWPPAAVLPAQPQARREAPRHPDLLKIIIKKGDGGASRGPEPTF